MMKKIILTFIIIISFINCFSQSLYDRKWGTVGDIGERIRISELKKSTNELYVVYNTTGTNNPNPYNENLFGEIYIYNPLNSSTKLFYRFPTPTPLPPFPHYTKYGIILESIKFDSNEDLIVYGRTLNPDLGTIGTYSSTTLPVTVYSGYTFISKINKHGKLVWLTYFHDLSQSKTSLTIDANNNIYVLTKRHKNDALFPASFQKSGDVNSTITYQDVISKLDKNGNHIWSTFYFNDKSEINSIVAANDGLYVYGIYTGNNASNNYFGTKNSFQEYPSGFTLTNITSSVFLSKFDFNGKRLWSTYFGNQISSNPADDFNNFSLSMTTIDNDVFFLTNHKSPYNQSINLATKDAYLKSPIHPTDNITLSMFEGNGKRSWTTYLYAGTSLQKTFQNALLITSNINANHSNINNLNTLDAYQPSHNGNLDTYTCLIANDGKSLKYGSFYGFDGSDRGITVASTNGIYIYGHSSSNLNQQSQFSTYGENFFGNAQGGYWGYFIGYFVNKTLSNRSFNDDFVISIYPNPTSDILNIKTLRNLSENTSFIVYDISGKKVLSQSSFNSNLNQVNISHLNSGMYILQIETSDFKHSIKFIKK